MSALGWSEWFSGLTRHMFFDDFEGLLEPDLTPRPYDPNVVQIIEYMKDNRLTGYTSRHYTYNQTWVIPYLFYNADLLDQSYTLTITRESSGEYEITILADPQKEKDPSEEKSH